MSLLSKPFSTTLPDSDALPTAYVRACKVEALSTNRGRFTKVTLPDGRSMTFVGPATKTEAVRNMLYQLRTKRWAKE